MDMGRFFEKNPKAERQTQEEIWSVLPPRKYKIAVIGISRGVGTTFIATSLAFLLSKFVEREGDSLSDCATYVEMRRPGPGEAMAFFGYGLDKRFAGNRFTDFYQLHKAGQPLDRKVNLHKGINWVVWRDSLPALESDRTVPGSASAENGSPEPLSALGEDIGSLPVGRLAGSFIVADSPPWEDLKEYDLVLAVMDPLPSRIYAGAAMYQSLKEGAGEGLEILWVVNRDNDAVDHGTLGRFLRLKHFFSVPLIQETCFYESQYGCKLPVEVLLPGGKEKEALEALARNVVTRLGLAGR